MPFGAEWSIIMKKLCAILASIALVASMSACGKKSSVPDVSELEKIAPDQLITVEAVSAITGLDMEVDENGVTTNGNASSVTYITNPQYSGDPVTIRIEQFSESLTTKQVWDDYEYSRIYRGDMEYIDGIGEDCYIAYPYINVYDRGCYIRISAGSGDDEKQRELLESLASIAAGEVERVIPVETYEAAKSNVIK